MRVIVVGAGLGGLTLAQGLRQAGIEVAVYEQDRPRARRQGISLHVDDRGMTALRACLPPGHLAMAEAAMGGPRERALALSEMDGQLAVMGARPLDGTPTWPGRQAHRPLLRAVLLTGLADAVRFGARCTRFEQRSDGTVRAWFSDGSADTADVLVGADGVGSVVRGQYLPHVRVADTGRRMLMGATPLRAIAGTGLPALIGHSPASLRSDDTMMALGVLRFPQEPSAARARWLPAMDERAAAEVEEYVMWALAATQEQLSSAASPTAVWHRAERLATNLHPVLRLVVAAAWPYATVALRIGTIPAMPAWPASAVTLLGDAIHPAPGFGGNLAMRDAHRLRDALVRAARGEQELHAAIGSYEDTMRRDSFPARPTSTPALDRTAAGTGAA
ncbi:FAD-dependent oxidoreductase [Actinophytocola sp.]|uniref:FAD-dependent oxidoreductase n=1 Tax=Actinophytocola sp. TaxID=1872138 RepID=UPI002D5D4F0E|nr:FAD-dependent monooxygenase [Actinophytocola sp.]HYQ69126.1 FAD-dependent monooxygenase [Actinophytocola sp.]